MNKFLKALLLFSFFCMPSPAISQLLPTYSTYPSITFNDATEPSTSGIPCVLSEIYLTYQSHNITSYRINADSLVLTALPSKIIGPSIDAPVPIDAIWIGFDTTIQFLSAGVYKAYVDSSTIIKELGAFRILPKLSTLPVYPLTEDSIQISLTVSQSNLCCPPQYKASAKISVSSIIISYQEILVDTVCIAMACSTTELGPTLNLPPLAKGTYQVFLEDTLLVGTVEINSRLTVSGNVRLMTDPNIVYIKAPGNLGIAGASVTAVKTSPCFPIYLSRSMVAALDTLHAITDSLGNFTLTLPDDGSDFEITVKDSGYFPQTLYTRNYALSESLPPQKNISFELIEDNGKTPIDTVELVVSVTQNDAPVESVLVAITSGADGLACPVDYIMESSYSSSYTGKNGQVILRGIALSPFIDYTWRASKYSLTNSLYQTGLIRFNKYRSPDTLLIKIEPSACEKAKNVIPGEGISIFPNPCNPSTLISFAKTDKITHLAIFDICGKKVANFKTLRDNTIHWNAANLCNGVYIVRAIINGKQLSRKILVQK